MWYKCLILNMPRTSERSPEGRERENKSEREQELPPDFDTRYAQIQDAIESGNVPFSSFPGDSPEFYFLLARRGALFHKAVQQGLIDITPTYVDKLISFASRETVIGGAIKSVLFPIPQDGEAAEAIVPKEQLVEYFKKVRDQSQGAFLTLFAGNLARELKELLPPTQKDFAFLREQNLSLLIAIFDGAHGDDFFDLAFPPSQDAQASATMIQFMFKETQKAHFRAMLDSAVGEQFMNRAFPGRVGMKEWIKKYPADFFRLLGRPAGQRFLHAAQSDDELRRDIEQTIREETKESPGIFLKNLSSPAGKLIWDIVKPEPSDFKMWMKTHASDFVAALNGILGRQIIEHTNLSADEIRQWKDMYADSFMQSLKSLFGDELLTAAFNGLSRKENLEWANKNLYLFIHYGLLGPKAKELFELVSPTQEEVRQWYVQDASNFVYGLRSSVGEKIFSFLTLEQQQRIVKDEPDLVFVLKLNGEIADPNGLFHPMHEAKHKLERECHIPLPPGEHTAGIEIEPFNSEKCELRTKAFSVAKKTELANYFSAFAAASEQWAQREQEQYGYSNTHLNIGALKKDIDIINAHRSLFMHTLPEAYLYAYFPIERISYRGIQKDLHTTLDIVDTDRMPSPEVIARLQYRIACIGGADATQAARQVDGIERMLDTTLDIFDSPEAQKYYESLLNDPETKDILLEINWLIRQRHTPAQERAMKIVERLQALKRLIGALGQQSVGDEIKKEKREIAREMESVRHALDHWPRIIKERQDKLRAILERPRPPAKQI